MARGPKKCSAFRSIPSLHLIHLKRFRIPQRVQHVRSAGVCGASTNQASTRRTSGLDPNTPKGRRGRLHPPSHRECCSFHKFSEWRWRVDRAMIVVDGKSRCSVSVRILSRESATDNFTRRPDGRHREEVEHVTLQSNFDGPWASDLVS